jgi:hypothetical protein
MVWLGAEAALAAAAKWRACSEFTPGSSISHGTVNLDPQSIINGPESAADRRRWTPRLARMAKQREEGEDHWHVELVLGLLVGHATQRHVVAPTLVFFPSCAMNACQ